MQKVYLAGPEVFLPNALEIGDKKKRICEAFGLLGFFPLDNGIDRVGFSPSQIASAIYSANVRLMEQADLLIANMTPFRGISMDVGTAFEVGFCSAKNIPVFGYTNIEKRLVDRINNIACRRDVLVDENGMDIENFGFSENLMIEVPARNTGQKVFTGSVEPQELFTNLSVFEQAVRHAAQMFQPRGAI